MIARRNDIPTVGGGDETFVMFGVLLNFLVAPDQTGNEISLIKGTLPPEVAIPLHKHPEPEVFYVLEGILEVHREDRAGWSTTQPGGVVAIPGNVKHALRNTSSALTTATKF